MPLFASLAVAALFPFAVAAPQGEQGKAGLLTPAERTSLRDKLAKYMQEDAAYSLSTGKDREKASRAREKAKEAFEDDWKKAEKKGNVMASMPDLRGIFENCFLLKPPTKTLGQLWNEKHKQSQLEYSWYLPKTYKPNVPHAAIWALPGRSGADAASPFAKATEYFAATWDKSAASADTIFHVPNPVAGLEYDPIPDFSREADDAEEKRRIDWMWLPFSETFNAYNIDRSRLYLDCGRGNCGFGVRFVSMFPDRFAGVVLRDPVPVDGLRLGSLNGVPFLLLKTAANAAAVEGLQKRIEEVSPGSVTVLDAAGEYPHKDLTPKIEEWLKSKRRNPMPTKVVIEPNHDMFNRAFWADIDVADRLVTAAPDKKPRIECVADRAANRLTVKTVGVEKFVLYLNDDLLDLDKEFTLVVNDKATTEKKSRSFRDMRENAIVRNDWEFLFPVRHNVTVAK
jgi:hypothetical protein